MTSQRHFFPLLATLLILMTLAQGAEASSFESWLRHFRHEALSKGISAEVFDSAFSGVTPNPRVVELDRKQPERGQMGFKTYLKNVMSQRRIDNGRAAFQENRGALYQVHAFYKVPPEVVIALWGVETSYGKNTGGFDLIEALATLAWEGRRSQFFKKELIGALQILQGGHVSREDFKGSWAGAMGQNQFMPSSWHLYAVDFNKDGHKDIWTTRADVFASTSNYLASNGWNPALKWGWEINYPQASHFAKSTRNYQDWLKLGVRFKAGFPSIPAGTPLKMIVPDGGDGRAYLVTSNFDVIMTWNKSTYFALTVGLLSDFVAKNSGGTASGYPQQSYNE